METARSVSTITVNFFKTLDMHASNLTQIVEEAQTVNDQKLSELEKKFEVILNPWITVGSSFFLVKINVFICNCRNALLMKKDNCWKKWQNCLHVLTRGRKNWYGSFFMLNGWLYFLNLYLVPEIA